MIEEARDAAVLQPSSIGAAGEALRRRLNRRHLLTAVGIALLFHILIVFGFWLMDRVRVRDIGDWSGPILVKIGVPDAMDSPAVDPGPLPDQPDQPEDIVPPDTPQAVSEAEQEAVAESSTPVQPEPSADSTRPAEEMPVQEAVPESRPQQEQVQARVQGEEDGNNYLIDFEGNEGEVGLTMWTLFIDYMPLPEVLEKSLIDNITVPEGLKYVTRESVLGDILVYWEQLSLGGDYYKKENAGTIRMQDRPYYWGLLRKYFNYDTADADWRTPNMRPVIIEFTVEPSVDASGVPPTDIKLVNHTNDPKVDEAILYGMMNGVLYNREDKPIKGRLTYRFNN